MENCVPTKRDRKTGVIRNVKKEEEKEKILSEHKKKYAIWGKG